MSNAFESPQAYNDSSLPSNVTRLRLKRVGVLSVGVFFGIAGVLMGLLAGAIMFLASLAGVAANRDAVPVGMAMGIGFLVMAPVIYGVMGFIAGVLNAAVYNIVAGFSGGIELDFSPE